MNTRIPSGLLSQAVALQEAGKGEAAETLYRNLLASDEANPALLNLLGTAIFEQGREEEGLLLMAKAIALNPDYASAYHDRGVALMRQAHYAAALEHFDKAIALQNPNVESHWNKALLTLLAGDYRQGWSLYEYRLKRAYHTALRAYTQPLWSGHAPVAGKRILLHAEQGLGDTIQFCRYLPMVEALGAKVLLEAPAALLCLLSTLKCSFYLVRSGDPLPPFDMHCPLPSLPLAFKTSVDTIPAEVPYLFVDPHKRDEWRMRLGPRSMLRVGLAWSGAAGHENDRHRSIPLEFFSSLQSLPYEFHCLQKEVKAQDALAALSGMGRMTFHGDRLRDFGDTAALASEMDLIISVDTSVAHLAGALGKTVWVLLPFVPDFRWMTERRDSPWYPTARLFRQPARGDWVSVMAQVRAELEKI